jgi:hypothetical protein
MTNLPVPNKPVNLPLHWPALLQLVLSLLAAFILFGVAAIIGLSAAFQYSTGSATTADIIQPFMVAASLAFAGLLVLPSAWYAWRHIASPDKPPVRYAERRGFVWLLTIVVALLEIGILWLGNWVSHNDQVAWFLLPPLNIIATGLPAAWVIYIGTRGLIGGAPRRLWGTFAAGLVLGPFIILVLELVMLALVGLIAILWVMLNPSLANQLYGLAIQLQGSSPNWNDLIRELVPFILNPGIIFLVFTFISVLVPLLEEALKPIGVWFLAGQKLNPAQGFGYGILSGAGFGLFENLGNTSGGATDWALLASTRISTLLLHCFTAGLLGWALVSAWGERRYLRLGMVYALAVIVHGLWNGMALLSAASSLPSVTNINLPASLPQIGTLSSWGIVAMGLVVFLVYIGMNANLRHQSAKAMVPVATQYQHQEQPDRNFGGDFVDEVHNRPAETDSGHSPGAEDSPPQAASGPINLQDEGHTNTSMGLKE